MVTVPVKPELIQWARERSGRSLDALRKVSPKYDDWERGEAQPTLKQLEKLANKTHTPLGYFFLPQPPEEELPIPDFRTVADKRVHRPSPELLDTIHTIQRRQEWMREYLMEQGQKPLTIIGSVTLNQKPGNVAGKIKKDLALPKHWATGEPDWTRALKRLREVVEEAGIFIIFNGVVGNNSTRKLDTKEFRGFVLCDEYAPFLFVNNRDAESARMFTIAHELVHLWLGKEGVFNLEKTMPAANRIEKFCNQVAAEFLVPEKDFLEVWPDAAEKRDAFRFLARHFKVSPLVAARRALDLELIDSGRFFSFYQQMLQNESRKQKKGGGDFWSTNEVRLGKRFGRAVVTAAKEGQLLYRDAYELTGLYGKTFDKFAKKVQDKT